MYERVWSGELNYPDEAKWDLALDFDQETGLFRCSGSLNGGAIEAHECADPVIAGYMEKSDDKIVLDSRWMPLIPAAPLEMQGRFAPFSSPDQIVSGTWRTPKDWPEARKAATVEDLETRMLYIVSSDDEIKSYRMAVRECSRLLNGMFGGCSYSFVNWAMPFSRLNRDMLTPGLSADGLQSVRSAFTRRRRAPCPA